MVSISAFLRVLYSSLILIVMAAKKKTNPAVERHRLLRNSTRGVRKKAKRDARRLAATLNPPVPEASVPDVPVPGAPVPDASQYLRCSFEPSLPIDDEMADDDLSSGRDKDQTEADPTDDNPVDQQINHSQQRKPQPTDNGKIEHILLTDQQTADNPTDDNPVDQQINHGQQRKPQLTDNEKMERMLLTDQQTADKKARQIEKRMARQNLWKAQRPGLTAQQTVNREIQQTRYRDMDNAKVQQILLKYQKVDLTDQRIKDREAQHNVKGPRKPKLGARWDDVPELVDWPKEGPQLAAKFMKPLLIQPFHFHDIVFFSRSSGGIANISNAKVRYQGLTARIDIFRLWMETYVSEQPETRSEFKTLRISQCHLIKGAESRLFPLRTIDPVPINQEIVVNTEENTEYAKIQNLLES